MAGKYFACGAQMLTDQYLACPDTESNEPCSSIKTVRVKETRNDGLGAI
jgi:hypothetical protein